MTPYHIDKYEVDIVQHDEFAFLIYELNQQTMSKTMTYFNTHR
jgi:hypothetical protein